ncbi:MAG: L,D-transpeptidase [Myxococcaceae bacterium]|nr:L,D-transpeptidase [Myxococcaceae bacterium]
MTWLLFATLASTPRIDAFLNDCPDPVTRFEAPRPGSIVHALGNGRVIEAGPARLVVSHCFIENHQLRTVQFVVERVEQISVNVGDVVRSGEVLANGRDAVACFDGQPAAQFVAERKRLFAPAAEPVLLIVDVDGHRAVRFVFGAPTHEWELAHGQAIGIKERRGDLKTPRGLYDVVSKSDGPFSGDYAAYYGGVWIKVNYPNAFDAARGIDAGFVTAAQAKGISSAWEERGLTLQRTKLGGGIGFHGWNEPWVGDAGWGLSWGCLVLHPDDARGFYDVVPVGTPVVLL